MIGTTHFTNAVVQRRDLTRVAAVRIGLPASASLPPFVDWPDDLAALVRGEVVMLEGGHEYDGRPIVPLDERGMRDAARRIRAAGITSVAIAAAFPVYSFASGPTNSMRGAAFLSGLSDAIVIDIGGTTTDIGSLRHGFPREANNVVEIGGVRTLFRMPDLLSVGLGGGSLVADDGRRVGPGSVGYRLVNESRVFGGTTLTATDVAVAARLIDLGDRRRVADLPADLLKTALARMPAAIEESGDRLKTDARGEPL